MQDQDRCRLRGHATALLGAISVALVPCGCGNSTGQSSRIDPSSPIDGSVTVETVKIVPAARPQPLIVPSTQADPTTTKPPPFVAVSSSTVERGAAPPITAKTTKPERKSKPKPRRKTNPETGTPHDDLIEGRPFLVQAIARTARIEPGLGWTDDIDLGGILPNDQQRADLIHHFTRWALAEHASIAAFARFSLQLLALGAPSSLVSLATSAMEDETRHARIGFGLVCALSGEPIRPGVLTIDGAITSQTTLADVLRLTVREGILGETLAALEARRAADVVESPWLKEQLVRVADDESRHAALAFRFAQWALDQDRTLIQVVESEVEAWQPRCARVRGGLESWGVSDSEARQSMYQAGLEMVIRPLVQQLSVGSASVLMQAGVSGAV